MLGKFWKWYDSHLALNTAVASGLFILQLVHLYWLTTHVVFLRAFGISLWDPSSVLQNILILVDYTEIPALISVSLIYINDLRKKFNLKSVWFLIFLNSQWLHIFWITDEFAEAALTGTGGGTILPVWLAWVAIAIDYLELPVIYDTMKKVITMIKKG